ncbi:MAG TPA: vWA domain-containing protein [Planctomycetota bacterium]|nr:vWA domain-containing protein [Planctomycetota bacterium]
MNQTETESLSRTETDMIHRTSPFLPALALAALPLAAPSPNQPPAGRRAVDLAICLDTSGSMQGLIDAARQGIWAIVNDLALAKPAPALRVALLTFGNDRHDAARGWVATQTGFTADLDLVSQKLFALTTDGGTELVGRVLQTALDELDWSTDADALRLVVVAGNESADQDREVPCADACRRAIAKGIMVHAIYCGDPNDGIAPSWREVARLADGRFHAIDHDRGTVTVQTPFDAQLQALSAQLNETYLPFGAEGARGLANQAAQDGNVAGLNPAAAALRAQCKATANYCNPTWDLVDACREQKVKLAEVPVEQLPEAMRAMTLAERERHVAAMQAKRAALQARIRELGARREAAAAEELKKRAIDRSKSFDFAVRQAVREQAAAKGLALAAPGDDGCRP